MFEAVIYGLRGWLGWWEWGLSVFHESVLRSLRDLLGSDAEAMLGRGLASQLYEVDSLHAGVDGRS